MSPLSITRELVDTLCLAELMVLFEYIDNRMYKLSIDQFNAANQPNNTNFIDLRKDNISIIH